MKQSFVYTLLLVLAAALNALPAFAQHLGVMDRLDYHCPAVYGVVLGCKGNTCTFKVERKLWGKIPRDTIEIRNWDLKGKQTKLYTFAQGQRLILSLRFVAGTGNYCVERGGLRFSVVKNVVTTQSGSFPLGKLCDAYSEQHRLLSQGLDLRRLEDSLALFRKKSPLHDSICIKIGTIPLSTFSSFRAVEGITPFIIETPLNNRLFVGGPNPLDVGVPGTDLSRYEMKINNGLLEYERLQVDREGPTQVSLYKKGKQPQLVYSRTFRALRIQFIVRIGGFETHSVVKKEKLAEARAIIADLWDTNMDSNAPILGYSFQIIFKGKTLKYFSVTGGELSAAVKEYLRIAPEGSQAVFSDIVCQSLQDKIETLPPLMYYLAD